MTFVSPNRDHTSEQHAEDLLPVTTGQDYWSTAAAPEAGLRSLRLADGPHGLRVQDDENPDHLGLGRSMPATCFPPAVTLASSWDTELAESIGAALAEEARAQGVDVVLGPGLNMKRSPLCGRNFEYFSEDPLQSGVMAAAVVRGLQSRGVAACLKHFAANNQESDRQRVSADIDERTLREIYLRTFQIAIRESSPWTIMSAYNRINGVFASENRWLLTEVLREEWGFDGVVISDWGAVHEPAAALNAGLDLRMPGRPDDERLRSAAKSGELDMEAVERTARRLALLAERTTPSDESRSVDYEAHHDLVRSAAASSAVLLTNRDHVLPFTMKPALRIGVIGELARTPRYQGAGSSAVSPTRLVSGLDALQQRADAAGSELAFAPGYALDGSADTVLTEEARIVADNSDVLVLFLGLPGSFEAEGRDRETIDLPADQLELIRTVKGRAGATVVALSNGSAVTTADWRDDVDAIVEFWLTGQAHGDAIADVLLGDVNPSGKLAETIPQRLADTPAYLNFPGEFSHVRYGEGIHIGYRHYDALDLNVDFPFGHGLSYTSFTYDDLRVDVHDAADPIAFTARLTLANSGGRDGAEVVQLYVSDHTEALRTPPRELRGWAKITLQAGESRAVEIRVARDDLAHWHPAARRWVAPGGRASVSVGSSSRDIRLTKTIELPGERISVPLTLWSTFREWLDDPTLGPRISELVESRGGIRGRMADLLADETGRSSVLDVPLSTLVEFPGVPLSEPDIARLAVAAD